MPPLGPLYCTLRTSGILIFGTTISTREVCLFSLFHTHCKQPHTNFKLLCSTRYVFAPEPSEFSSILVVHWFNSTSCNAPSNSGPSCKESSVSGLFYPALPSVRTSVMVYTPRALQTVRTLILVYMLPAPVTVRILLLVHMLPDLPNVRTPAFTYARPTLSTVRTFV